MNKRSIPIAIVSCILALAGIAGYFTPKPTEAVPARLLMENAGGRVVFTHQAHSTPGGAYGDATCATCHHELLVAPQAAGPGAQPEVMRCTACHGSADDPKFITSHQDFYRANGGDQACIACHHTRLDGFSSLWNHEDHKTYAGDDCQACHHPESYERGDGKVMNIKPQKCSNCHTAKPNPMTTTTRKDAGHIKCESCHSDLFAEGAKDCATCHTQKRSADELAQGTLDKNYTACASCHKPIPGGMDAFHGSCMSCHDKAGKGPGKKATCAQCHRQ